MRATFTKVCQSLQVDRVGQKGHDSIGRQRCCEKGEPAPGKSSLHEKEEGPQWHGGRRDWRGWQRRGNGQQRWVNK